MLKRWWHVATCTITVLLAVVGFLLQDVYSDMKGKIDDNAKRGIETQQEVEVIKTHIEYIREAVDIIIKEIKEK